MALEGALAATAALSPDDFARFRDHIDAAWIQDALEGTETATLRRRRLPAEQVVWLVVGMGLYRNVPIREIVRGLDLALPARNKKALAPSAIPQARERLGDEAMQWLFELCGRIWAGRSAEAHRYRDLTVYGVDGSTLTVPDSEDNRLHFGGPTTHRGPSGYPLVRVVVLMTLRSHLLKAGAFGSYHQSETSLAEGLWPQVPDDSLTILDRGFLGAPTLIPLAEGGNNRHWLTRAKSNSRWRTLKRLGRGDELVEMDVSPAARKQNPSLPKTWTMRAIQYQRKGFRPQTLLTSLLDPKMYPAAELAALYHERWELELGYDEIKTDLLDRREALRSQTARAIWQELWGVLLAYNLVRLEMERIAAVAGVPPTRISFITVLRELRMAFVLWQHTEPGALPARIRKLEDDLARFVLPPRRTARSYPRAVKVKMSNYNRKRPKSPTETKPN